MEIPTGSVGKVQADYTAANPAPAVQRDPEVEPVRPTDSDYAVAIDLYKTYVQSFLQAIGFYITIHGALFGFALSKPEYREALVAAGLGMSGVALYPMKYAWEHTIALGERIRFLANALRRSEMDPTPLLKLAKSGAALWGLISAAWIAIAGYVVQTLFF